MDPLNARTHLPSIKRIDFLILEWKFANRGLGVTTFQVLQKEFKDIFMRNIIGRPNLAPGHGELDDILG